MDMILRSLFPVFALVALGMGLRRWGFMGDTMERDLNRLAYWVCLPGFLAYKTAVAPALDHRILWLLAAMLLVTFVMVTSSLLLTRLLRLPPGKRGAFLQSGFRGNQAYIGLPIVLYALARQPEETRALAETLAILVMAPLIIVYNLLAVTALEWDRPGGQRNLHPAKLAGSILLNPLVLGCLVGLLWNVLPLDMPGPLGKTLDTLGMAAFPMALLAIGSRLVKLDPGHAWMNLGATVLVKNVLGLALAVGLAAAMNLSFPERSVLLVFSTTPTAIASFVLAEQMGGDRETAAGQIAATTLASVFSLAAAVALIGG